MFQGNSVSLWNPTSLEGPLRVEEVPVLQMHNDGLPLEKHILFLRYKQHVNTNTQQKLMLALNLCDLTGLRVPCFAASCCCRRLHIPCRSLVTFANTLWMPSRTPNGTRSLCLGNWMAPRKMRFWVQKQPMKTFLHDEFPPLTSSLTDSSHYTVPPTPPGLFTNSAPAFATNVGRITRTFWTTWTCGN